METRKEIAEQIENLSQSIEKLKELRSKKLMELTEIGVAVIPPPLVSEDISAQVVWFDGGKEVLRIKDNAIYKALLFSAKWFEEIKKKKRYS